MMSRKSYVEYLYGQFSYNHCRIMLPLLLLYLFVSFYACFQKPINPIWSVCKKNLKSSFHPNMRIKNCVTKTGNIKVIYDAINGCSDKSVNTHLYVNKKIKIK